MNCLWPYDEIIPGVSRCASKKILSWNYWKRLCHAQFLFIKIIESYLKSTPINNSRAVTFLIFRRSASFYGCSKNCSWSSYRSFDAAYRYPAAEFSKLPINPSVDSHDYWLLNQWSLIVSVRSHEAEYRMTSVSYLLVASKIRLIKSLM